MADFWKRAAHSVNHIFSLCLFLVWLFPIYVSRKGICFWLGQFLAIAFFIRSIYIDIDQLQKFKVVYHQVNWV